jgi:peroxiredoxin
MKKGNKMAKKRTNNTRLYILVGIFILCVGVYYFIPTKEHSHKLKDIDITKIEFNTLVNPTNTTIEDIKAKPRVLMLFFTLNNKEVKEKTEMFNELHKHEKVSVVGYMLSGTSRAEKFAKNNNVQFPIVKPSKEYMAAMPTTQVPMAFFVNTKSLKVVSKFPYLRKSNIDMALSVVE